MRWIGTLVMIADPLTKVDADVSVLLRVMNDGKHCIQATEEATEAKVRSCDSRQRAKMIRDQQKR